MELKICLECSSPIRGRSDKKFCDDGCRNNYNNRLNTERSKCIRATNAILLRNRRILEALLKDNKLVKIQNQYLIESGFNSKYFTHTLLTQKGKLYKFVYEYGYLALDDAHILIVKEKISINEPPITILSV